MEKLMEKFRGGVIAIAIASIAIVACVCMFSTSANAESNAGTLDGSYTLDESYLTCNVQAPRNATFDATWQYTFTPNASGQTYGGTPIAAQTVITNVADGKWAASGLSDGWEYWQEYHGPGSSAAGTVTYQDTATIYAYIAQKQLSSFIDHDDLDSDFPTNGEYIWDVATSQIAPTDQSAYHCSQSAYQLKIWVGVDAGTRQILGATFHQSMDDDGNTVLVDKKNPTQAFGRSNHQYDVPATSEPVTLGGKVYEGFTFENEYDKVVDTSYDTLTISKTVDGALGDRTKDFTFTPMLYCSNWNELTEASPTLTAYILDSNDAYVSTVTFNITKTTDGTPATAVPSGTSGNTFKLKHGQKLVFDGQLHGQANKSSLLPVGTYYKYTEAAESGYDAQAKTYSAPDTTGTTTDDDPSGSNGLVVSYYTDGTVSNPSAIVGETSETNTNHSDVTNKYTQTPTGFLIDALPYALMIGIPILALIIWIVVRKRKATHQF